MPDVCSSIGFKLWAVMKNCAIKGVLGIQRILHCKMYLEVWSKSEKILRVIEPVCYNKRKKDAPSSHCL